MPKHKTRGPLSLQGAVKKQLYKSGVELSLRVVSRDSAATGRGLPALLHPSSIQQLLLDSFSQELGPQESSNSSSSSSAGSSTLFLQLASGSDCVLHARACSDVQPGSIQLDEVQQANLRLCAGEQYKFSIFQPDSNATEGDDAASPDEDEDQQQAGTDMQEAAAVAAASAGSGTRTEADDDSDLADAAAAADTPFELTDLDCEVQLLHAQQQQQQQPVQVDAVVLTRAFCKQCCWRVLAVNEYVMVELPGVPALLLRVTATNTLTAEEQQDALGYHCFRGLLTPDTTVYMMAAASQQQQQQQSDLSSTPALLTTQLLQLSVTDTYPGGPAQQQQDAAAGTLQAPPVQSRAAAAGVRVQLLNAISRAAAPPATNVVHVYTNDGEWFPVKKKLLRSCIALTKAVRDSGDAAPTVHVDIDTLTFDRVLIFLEAHALQRQPPGFAVHYLPDLQQAGEQLGLRSLQEYCARLKGTRQAALGVYSFADVQRANASGKVWLLLDGMVLDVGRWLPEHPGGATIIPAQSLNCDCSRFFEMYHASRESFLYIAEFYIGELLPADLPDVPLGGKQPPSADFLAQLREYTVFRQPMLAEAARRAPVTHLGAGKARAADGQ